MRFGSYKYLMISYALYSLVYGFVEICTQPVIREYFRANDLRHFDGWNLLKIYVIPASLATVWFWAYLFILTPSDVKNDFVRLGSLANSKMSFLFRKEIQSIYNEDIGKVGYIAFLYYYPDKSGNLVINWIDFVSCCIPCGVMQTCFMTMIVCGWKTYQKMRNLKQSMSKRTKDLNSQLFKALVLQTLVPMCTMFAPVGSLLILPMFSIGVPPIFANIPSFYACLYPALDATIAIFMIRDFRDTVLCRKRVHPSLISTSTASGKHVSSHISG
uniref:Seven TM Receptor n=1 Tax=Caenorhabditis tropicalis TaxID=1561998 RepID=A0A1I7T5J1_9PELO